MLDARVYRAAFIPLVVAVVLAAFSLTDRPGPRTTRIAPDAFSGERVLDELRTLRRDFPDRTPGGGGDAGMAAYVEQELRAALNPGTEPAPVPTPMAGALVQRDTIEADTVEGEAVLDTVIGVKRGLSDREIVIVAHRDARGAAELSGTATLLELARVYQGRDVAKTLVFASVSGGSGGYAGARAFAERAAERADAVIVLGDLAGARVAKPWVVSWSSGGDTGAPLDLRRTVEAALRAETGEDPGGPRALAQWVRRAFPLTLSEQGPLAAAGAPAVLVSVSGERGPRPQAPIDGRRLETFGRGVLRAITAIEEAEPERPASPFGRGDDGIVTLKRLLPDWAVRLLVGCLLLPALLAAVDAFFRARRRGLGMRAWSVWVLAGVVPFVAAYGWTRALSLAGGVDDLGHPGPPGAVPLDGAGGLALASVGLIAAAGWFVARPAVQGLARARGDVTAGGAAGAVGLGITGLAALVWLVDPYAAAMLAPAAHLWLLVTAPGTRMRGAAVPLAVVTGLIGPVVVLAYYELALRLGPGELLWELLRAFAGGTVAVSTALVLCAYLGLLGSVVTIVARRARAGAAAPPEPPEPVRTRGPLTYAGPGSLGGTESALRR